MAFNFKNLLNLFLESHCPLCQRSTAGEICQQCSRRLQKCRMSNSYTCQNPLPVFAWGVYGGLLKQAIRAMKYENQPQVARPLGQWLGQAWLESQLHRQKLVVIPIPLHKSKQKQRGYNQAALIAKSFCEETGLKLKLDGLERVRETKAQFSLSELERKANLAEAFQVGQKFRSDAPVLLVDDIYTTGATAASAVQALGDAGVTVHGLVAIAATMNKAQ